MKESGKYGILPACRTRNYACIFTGKAPWFVSEADLRMEESKITVRLAHDPAVPFLRPECESECPVHDTGRASGGTWCRFAHKSDNPSHILLTLTFH
jgi:hypothetical protein